MAKSKTGTRRPRGRPRKPILVDVRAVEPLDQIPPAPEWLGEIGRAYWDRVATILVRARTLTDLDLEALGTLCDWWEAYRSKVAHLREHPDQEIVTVGMNGAQQKSVYAQARDQAFSNLTKLWPKFGITPESHQRYTGMVQRVKQSSKGKAAPVVGSDLEQFAAQKYAEQ